MPVTGVRLVETEPEVVIMVDYLRSTVEGCGRPGNQRYELDGNDIFAEVTLMTPPPTPWGLPCDEDMIQVEDIVRVTETLTLGRTYRVSVNGRHTTAFTLTELNFGDSIIAATPIENVELVMPEGPDSQYALRVYLGLPEGGSCTAFNGYEIRRSEPTRINVTLTHHMVIDPAVACASGWSAMAETLIPLGSDFEGGQEFTVSVNSDMTETFVAR